MKTPNRLVFFAVTLFAAVMLVLLRQHDSSPEEISSKTKLALEELDSTESGSVRLAAIGDVRSGDDNQLRIANLLEQVHQKAPLQGVILLGDNAPLFEPPAKGLRDIIRPYAPLIRDRVPFYAVLGNHDLRRGMRKEQLGFEPYNMDGRPYYSRTFGGVVEVFFLDSNTMANDREQLEWLKRSLDESTARWKVVAMHHPLYATARRKRESRSLTLLLGPIFSAKGVDIAVSGHNHLYERLRPIDGVTYITAGSGGELTKGGLQPENFLRVAGNDTDNVALILQFTPDACRFLAYTAAGQLADSGTLRKEPTESENKLDGGE